MNPAHKAPGQSLLRELPPVRRARDFHLYDVQGRRYLDLYQDGGRAVLGHRPAELSKTLKNFLSRGLFSSLPSPQEKQLEKALRGLFPDRPVCRVYLSDAKIQQVLALLGTERIVDPVLTADDGSAGTPAAFWRPFAPVHYEQYPAIVPLLPFPGEWGVRVVCVSSAVSGLLPPADLISPFILAGLIRAVFDLIHTPEPGYSGLESAFRTALWRLEGRYLVPRYERDQHPQVFRGFLSNGFLLSPEYDTPGIIPLSFSSGEAAAFRSTAREISSGSVNYGP